MDSTNISTGYRDDATNDDVFDDEAILRDTECEIASTQRRRKLLSVSVYSVSCLAVVAMIILVSVVKIPSLMSNQKAGTPVTANGQQLQEEDAPSVPTASPVVAGHGHHSTSSPSSVSTTMSSSTKAPTSLRSSAPTVAPTQVVTTKPPTHHPIKLGCLTDRFDNENMKHNHRLYPGQYICSRDEDQRYHFGLSESGDLIWKDSQRNHIHAYYENPYYRGNRENANLTTVTSTTSDSHELYEFYLSLRVDGTLVMQRVHLHGNGKTTVLWAAEPNYQMGLTEQCLPNHDCPYLHLHQDGVMVLSWVNGTNLQEDWQEHSFKRVYDL